MKIAFTFLIIIVAFGNLTIFGQKELPLNEKRITLNVENQPLRDILHYLSILQDIPVAFEESMLDRDHNDFDFATNLPYQNPKKPMVSSGFTPIKKHWFTVKVNDEKLETVLDIIIRQLPNYKWEINDGVVNIFPANGRDERFKELLDLKIKSFGLDKNQPIFLIRTKLLELPELKQFLMKNDLSSTNQRTDYFSIDRRLPDGMEFADLTLRDLLNQITKTKRGGWILRMRDGKFEDGKEVIDISI